MRSEQRNVAAQPAKRRRHRAERRRPAAESGSGALDDEAMGRIDVEPSSRRSRKPSGSGLPLATSSAVDQHRWLDAGDAAVGPSASLRSALVTTAHGSLPVVPAPQATALAPQQRRHLRSRSSQLQRQILRCAATLDRRPRRRSGSSRPDGALWPTLSWTFLERRLAVDQLPVCRRRCGPRRARHRGVGKLDQGDVDVQEHLPARSVFELVHAGSLCRRLPRHPLRARAWRVGQPAKMVIEVAASRRLQERNAGRDNAEDPVSSPAW